MLYNSDKFTGWMNEASEVGDIDILRSIIGDIVSDIEGGNMDINDLF